MKRYTIAQTAPIISGLLLLVDYHVVLYAWHSHLSLLQFTKIFALEATPGKSLSKPSYQSIAECECQATERY
jgi:hypothetical protein